MTYGEYYDFLVGEFQAQNTLPHILSLAQSVLKYWTPKMRKEIQHYKESAKHSKKK